MKTIQTKINIIKNNLSKNLKPLSPKNLIKNYSYILLNEQKNTFTFFNFLDLVDSYIAAYVLDFSESSYENNIPSVSFLKPSGKIYNLEAGTTILKTLELNTQFKILSLTDLESLIITSAPVNPITKSKYILINSFNNVNLESLPRQVNLKCVLFNNSSIIKDKCKLQTYWYSFDKEYEETRFECLEELDTLQYNKDWIVIEKFVEKK